MFYIYCIRYLFQFKQFYCIWVGWGLHVPPPAPTEHAARGGEEKQDLSCSPSPPPRPPRQRCKEDMTAPPPTHLLLHFHFL